MTREEAKDYIREWCPYDRQEEIIRTLEQEPCEDAISRQAVMEHYSTGEIAHCHHISRNNLLDFVEQLPSVTPQPKIGHWIVNKKVDTAYDISGYKSWAISYACDHCGFIHQAIENHGVYSYCPKCGVKMVEPQESEDKE